MSDELVWQSRLGFEAEGLRHSRSVGRFNAYITHSDLHTIVVLAERQDNPGASITNAYEAYVAAVCRAEGIDMNRCRFFELYVEPGRRKGNTLFLEKDGLRGSASLDRVETDPGEVGTRWLPGEGLGEALWASLKDSVQLDWSYPVPRRMRTG